MKNIFCDLATQILEKNDQVSFQKAQTLLKNFKEIRYLVNTSMDEHSIFVFCEILSKNILGQKMMIENTESLENDEKQKFYAQNCMFILNTMTKILENYQPSSLVGKSLINLISICLRSVLLYKKQKQYFFRFLKLFFPSFNYENQEVQTFPLLSIGNSEVFCIGVNILIHLIQYSTKQLYSEKYYTLRFNVFYFRNTYLPVCLQIAISYGKFILSSNESAQILRIYIQYLDTVITFPFNFHKDFEGEKLEVEEVYFPTFFRSLLCDHQFNLILFKKFGLFMQNNQSFKEKQFINNYIQIIGRFVSANPYVFEGQEERNMSRQTFSKISYELMDIEYYDHTYLGYLLSLQNYVITNYRKGEFEFKLNWEHFVERFLSYGKSLIKYSEIVIEDNKNNPITKLFQILSDQISVLQELPFFLPTLESMVSDFLLRISNNEKMIILSKKYPWERKNQTIKFYSFLEPFASIAIYRVDYTLFFFQSVDLDMLNECALTFWLHSASLILPQKNASIRMTKVIIKFFHFCQQMATIGSVNLMSEILKNMYYRVCPLTNQPMTNLWNNVKLLTNRINDSETFIMNIVEECYNKIQNSDPQVINEILKLLKIIFLKVKGTSQHHEQYCYEFIKEWLLKIEQSILNNTKYYKLRITFMEIVSLVWIKDAKYRTLSEIHTLITKPIQSQTSLHYIIHYFNDLTGIINELQYIHFKLIFQLSLPSLTHIFHTLSSNQQLFNHEPILQSCQKFVFVLLTSYSNHKLFFIGHSQLPIQIYQLLVPTLLHILHFNYDPILVQVWQELIMLHPLARPLPLHKDMKLKNAKEYNVLLHLYSENLSKFSRIQQLMQVQEYFRENVEMLRLWWLQVMEHNYYPDVNLCQLVSDCTWIHEHEIIKLGSLVYKISNYDRRYWFFPGSIYEETEFVVLFLQQYKVIHGL